jgi:hypothetical protein
VALHPPWWRPSLLLPPRQESSFRAALVAAPCAFVITSTCPCSGHRRPEALSAALRVVPVVSSVTIIISSIISILAEPSRCISGHASCRPSFVISFSNRHAISSIAPHAVQLDLHLLVSSHHHIDHRLLCVTRQLPHAQGGTSAPGPTTRQPSRRTGPRPPRPLASEVPLPRSPAQTPPP